MTSYAACCAATAFISEFAVVSFGIIRAPGMGKRYALLKRFLCSMSRSPRCRTAQISCKRSRAFRSAHDLHAELGCCNVLLGSSEHAVGTFLQVTQNKVSETGGTLPAVSVSPEDANSSWVVRLIDEPNPIKTASDIVVSEAKVIVCVGYCTVPRDSRDDAGIMSQ